MNNNAHLGRFATATDVPKCSWDRNFLSDQQSIKTVLRQTVQNDHGNAQLSFLSDVRLTDPNIREPIYRAVHEQHKPDLKVHQIYLSVFDQSLH